MKLLMYLTLLAAVFISCDTNKKVITASGISQTEENSIEFDPSAKSILGDVNDQDTYVQRNNPEDVSHLDKWQQNFINKYNIRNPDKTNLYNYPDEPEYKQCSWHPPLKQNAEAGITPSGEYCSL